MMYAIYMINSLFNILKIKKSIKRLMARLLAGILAACLLINSSSCILIPKPKLKSDYGYIKLIVSEYNSGPGVEGATVTLTNINSNLTNNFDKFAEIKKLTDENGIVIFDKILLNKPYRIEIEKSGYSKTVIDVLSLHSSVDLSTTLRKPRFLASQTAEEIGANEMSIKYAIYDSPQKSKKISPDSSGIYKFIENKTIYIEAVATSTNIPIAFMYAKIANPPGAEFLTSPRLYSKGNSLEGVIDSSYVSGRAYLFIDSYDENDNRYEIMIPVYFSTSNVTLGASTYLVQKKKPALLAYHINTNIKYYSQDSFKVVNETTHRRTHTNAYIILRWKKWEESDQRFTTERPIGYALYRSYNGKNFQKIAVVSSDKDSYIDSSSENGLGRRIWYAISSIYPLYESPTKLLGSVVIMPMLSVKLLTPADGATNVQITPTFRWEFEGLKDYEEVVTYLYDIWIYDMSVNRNYHYPAILNSEKYFKTKNREITLNFSDYIWTNLTDNKLQKNKPYEWSLELVAAEWVDEKNNSYSISILSDYNGKISLVAIPPQKYNLFITGE